MAFTPDPLRVVDVARIATDATYRAEQDHMLYNFGANLGPSGNTWIRAKFAAAVNAARGIFDVQHDPDDVRFVGADLVDVLTEGSSSIWPTLDTDLHVRLKTRRDKVAYLHDFQLIYGRHRVAALALRHTT